MILGSPISLGPQIWILADLTGPAHIALVAHRQLPTATSPAAGNHVAAILRLHAFAESVDLGPAAIVGLKCSFRHLNNFLRAG